MLNLKRGPQDPILPIRATKHPRTTALYADSPTASQNEGLLSQWISSLVNLTTRAASGVFTEGLLLSTTRPFFRFPFAELPTALRAPPPQTSSSHSRRTELARPNSTSVQPISIRSSHLRRGRLHKMRLKGTPPRLGSPKSHDPPPQCSITSGPHVAFVSPSPQPQASKMVGSFISTPTTPMIPSQLEARRIVRSSSPSPEPPSTPIPGPSRCTSTGKDVTVLALRPPIPGAFLSPSTETPAPKPPCTPQLPQTEPREEAKLNPFYRSMAPPPSPNLPPMPTNPVNIVETPISSTATSTPVSSSPLPSSREEVDATIAVVEKRLAGRVVKKVFSRKTARPHIYQDAVSLHLLRSFVH